MPTVLGLIYVALAAVLLFRRGYHWVLSLALAAPVGVLVSIGANDGVPIFHFLGLGALAACFMSTRQRQRQRKQVRPGSTLLIVLVWWSVTVTLLAPALFAGTPVLIAAAGIDNQLADPGELAYSTSNVAQVAYLIIGVAVVFYLGGIKGLPSGFLSPGLALVATICFIRLLSVNYGTPWVPRFFDNSQSVAYIETFIGGKERFRGVFAEPSELAASSLVTLVYFLTRLPVMIPNRRIWAFLVIAMTAANLWASTSGTAIAASCALLAIIGGIGLHNFFSGNWRIPIWGAMLGVAIFIGAVLASSVWIEALTVAIQSKMGTASFSVRTGADMFSLEVLANTWGLGAGLGSNRPSTFLPMLLSNIGIVGALIFIFAAVTLARRAWGTPDMRPVVWAFVALMVSKSVAGPNFSDPLIWLMLGMFANAAWNQPGPETLDRSKHEAPGWASASVA